MSKQMVFNVVGVTILTFGLLAGCSSPKDSTGGAGTSSQGTGAQASPAADQNLPDIEVWWTNNGYKPIDKGSQRYDYFKKTLGVGVTTPYVNWNGGTDYLNALNARVAAANIPNVFMPWNGNEADLAKNGALADLTDLLPKYAPNMWKLIPQSVWNTVKANDPTGQGHIYWVPLLSDYQKESGLIRKDWLDKLNLPMPKTTADLVNVFTAFRDKDPNGNGQKDEIPTSGRQGATWMNPLFEPFGVAMWEGNPMFDVYDGQLTYSGVTKNAKDALMFIADLYKQGLLDKEFALNDKTKWDGKTNAGKTGLYFHWAQTTSVNHLFAIEKNTGVKADIAVLPPVQAPGYEGKGFITTFKVGLPQFVVSAKQDQAHLMASMKFLNELADTSKWDDMYWGIEGMDYEMKNGAKQLLPYDQSKQQLALIPSKYWGTLDFNIQLAQEAETPDTKWAIEQDIRDMKDLQPYVRDIASDGMPDSVYDNYPDIKNNKLWQEYATKIIIGEYPISKFDEFVQKWNASGGAEVTKAARAWYDKVKAVK